MKFLVGLILGVALSIGIMSKQEPRQQLLEAASSLVEKMRVEKVRIFSSASNVAETRDIQNSIPPAVVEETAAPASKDNIEQVSSELRTVNPTPMADEPSDETNDLATSVSEEENVPFSTLGTSLFQVAWSPFRSETSARGFAAQLERQVSQKFQVIKRGPGRYEVGFLFESESERADILEAINEITGFETTKPPRIVSR